jgi:ssDNA-binding Zn-finger/Zn-ribbon topoisomerase 1
MVESSSFKQALIKNEQALKKLNLMVGPCPECHHDKNLDVLHIYLS